MLNGICGFCGGHFEQRKSGQKKVYCTRKCKDRANDKRRREERLSKVVANVCEGCGVEYMPYYTGSRQRFCSKACGRRHTDLKRKGFSLRAYNTMFASQDGKCAICGVHQSDQRQALGVYLCNVSGKAKGLLCMSCSTGLGLFGNDVECLIGALTYVGGSKV